MTRAITLTFPDEAVSVEAVLLAERAPRTCTAVWAHLPSAGYAQHGIYSGSEIYTFWERHFIVEPERATSQVEPGDVAYYSQRGGVDYGWPDAFSELCLFYDRDAEPRMPGGPVAVTIFARMVGDPASFFAVCRRMRIEGQKRLLVARGSER